MTILDDPTQTDPAATADAVDAFADRLFAALLGAQEVQALYLGDRLGWYRALADAGAAGLDAPALAAATGTDARYAQEWLEHQAVSGYVVVDDPAAGPTERRFALPPAQAEVLADPESLAFMAPFARFVASAGTHLDRLAEAYRHGTGLAWADMGRDAREAQADANRAMFLHQLGQELLPAVPELHASLGRAARIADVGCGGAWSSIGLARTYPGVAVDGFDIDPASVELARANVAGAGLADRVAVHLVDAGGDVGAAGAYDAAFAFECVHDMPDPVSVLAAMRRLVGDGGTVIVMDERTADAFDPDAGDVERLMYGYSIMCCLPDGRAHDHSVGTGTVMRTDTLAAYARDAGFADVEVLPIDHDFFRFYRLSSSPPQASAPAAHGDA